MKIKETVRSEHGQALLEFALVALFVTLLVLSAAAVILGALSGPQATPGTGHNGYSRLMN